MHLFSAPFWMSESVGWNLLIATIHAVVYLLDDEIMMKNLQKLTKTRRRMAGTRPCNATIKFMMQLNLHVQLRKVFHRRETWSHSDLLSSDRHSWREREAQCWSLKVHHGLHNLRVIILSTDCPLYRKNRINEHSLLVKTFLAQCSYLQVREFGSLITSTVCCL